MPTVTLTSTELRAAASVAVDQFLLSKLELNLPDRHGLTCASLDTEFQGVAAEMAYHKFRGMYFAGNIGTYKGADAGNNVQIRSTTNRTGSLIIRPNDNPDHYYVLVICEMPRYRIVGYIQGADAMQDRFFQTKANRPGAWFVPQSELVAIKSEAA